MVKNQKGKIIYRPIFTIYFLESVSLKDYVVGPSIIRCEKHYVL